MGRSLQKSTEDLSGRAALVTGGSRGIGAAIARRLARAGADVAISYRSEADAAAEVVDDIRAAGRQGVAIQADVADPADVRRLVAGAAEQLGGLDVLVNSAGVFHTAPLRDVTLEDFDNLMAIHVRAPFLATQAAAAHLGDDGRVITIGSNLAERMPEPETTLYSMSKSALLGMTRGLAWDLGERGISASLVQPGNTDTDMNPAANASAEKLRTIPMGRYAEADDIAATVAFLAGPGGRFVTGSAVTVDGGVNA